MIPVSSRSPNAPRPGGSLPWCGGKAWKRGSTPLQDQQLPDDAAATPPVALQAAIEMIAEAMMIADTETHAKLTKAMKMLKVMVAK